MTYEQDNQFEQGSKPQSPEEANYREALLQHFGKRAAGTVGIYTCSELTSSERSEYTANVGRLGRVNDEPSILSKNDGWQNYGERDITSRLIQGSNIRATHPEVGDNIGYFEETHFMPSETKGKIDVIYGYKAPLYLDPTRRPGNALEVQFQLSPEDAVVLQRALEADPTMIDEVVERQVLASGIPQSGWEKMKPTPAAHDIFDSDFKSLIPSSERALTIVTHESGGKRHIDTRLFRDQNSVLPSEAQELTPSAETDDTTSEVYREALEESREGAKLADTKDQALDTLADEIAYFQNLEKKASNPTDAEEFSAMWRARMQVFDEVSQS